MKLSSKRYKIIRKALAGMVLLTALITFSFINIDVQAAELFDYEKYKNDGQHEIGVSIRDGSNAHRTGADFDWGEKGKDTLEGNFQFHLDEPYEKGPNGIRTLLWQDVNVNYKLPNEYTSFFKRDREFRSYNYKAQYFDVVNGVELHGVKEDIEDKMLPDDADTFSYYYSYDTIYKNKIYRDGETEAYVSGHFSMEEPYIRIYHEIDPETPSFEDAVSEKLKELEEETAELVDDEYYSYTKYVKRSGDDSHVLLTKFVHRDMLNVYPKVQEKKGKLKGDTIGVYERIQSDIYDEETTYYDFYRIPEVPDSYAVNEVTLMFNHNYRIGLINPDQGAIDVRNDMLDHYESAKSIALNLTSIRPEVIPQEPEYLDWSDDSDKKINMSVNSNANKEKGEQDGGFIPIGIVEGWKNFKDVIGVAGGVAGAVGAVALGLTSGNEDADDERKKTYRMVIYKDFGNIIRRGQQVIVYACIVERDESGQERANRELTSQISIFSGDEAFDVYQQEALAGEYKAAYVSVRDDVPKQKMDGIVCFKFTGKGGTFTNRMKFSINEPRLFFAPVGLTFIAEKRQTLAMPFTILGMKPDEIATPHFDIEIESVGKGFVHGKAEEYFTGIEVVKDPDRPDLAWNLRITETGKKSELGPGCMETFTCRVIATVSTGKDEIKLEDSFDLFRFVEGLRFVMEPLKCYAVGQNEEIVTYRPRHDGETLREFREKHQAAKEVLGEDGIHDGWAYGAKEGSYAVIENVTRYTMATTKLRVALFTWGAGQLDKNGKFVFGDNGEGYAEIPPFDGTDPDFGVRPVNPLPDFGSLKIEFKDVEGASVLKDKDGNDVAQPAKTLGVDWRMMKIDRSNGENEILCHVMPTKGVMIAPNRTQMDVTASCTWSGRKFSTTLRINAISQPYRFDYADRTDYYDKLDAKKRKALERIQEKILSSKERTIEVEGESAIVNGLIVANDVLTGHYIKESIKDGYRVVTGKKSSGGASILDDIKGNIERQRKRKIAYGGPKELMPLYHYIETMLDGYDRYYGFNEPDYQRALLVYEKFEKGLIGTEQAAMEAFYSRDLAYCDAVRMTVQGWNRSWLLIGARIGCAIMTEGQSEWLFIPLASIGQGLEKSLDYIDKGGNDTLEAFRIGCDAAGKQAVFDVALGATIEYGLKWGSFLKGLAEDLSAASGAEALFQKGLGALTKMFSTGSTGARAAAAAKGVANDMAKVRKGAQEAIESYRAEGGLMTSELLERDINYTLGRIEGKVKLQELKKLVGPEAKTLTEYEKRQIIYAVQGDKHAMRALMAEEGELGLAARKLFNKEITKVQQDGIAWTRRALADQYGVPIEDIDFVRTSGNVMDDILAGRKTPMDLDVTFRRKVIENGKEKWVDIAESEGQSVLDQTMYKLVNGKAASSAEEAAAWGRRVDQSLVSSTGPESYGTYEDAMRICKAERAGEALDDAATVGMTAERKCIHWKQLAEQASADANRALAAGNMKAAKAYAEASEAFIEESARQFTKQAERIVGNRLTVLRERGINLPFDMQPFLQKVEVLKMSGLEKVGGNGLTSVEVEDILAKKFNSTLEETYRELNELTVRLDAYIATSQMPF